MKKLIPAIVLLLISAIVMSTASYAWFSMNNQVTVTGMTIRTEVNNNLLIAPAANTDGTNAPSTTMPAESTYGTHIVQNVEALLEPVSTTTAAYNDFWYTSTTNVISSGDAKTDTYIAYDASNRTAFNANYGTASSGFSGGTEGAFGYVDYVFALQATNTSTSASTYVNMTKCDLTYMGTATTEKAFRVAVLVQDCTSVSAAEATANLKTILTPASAANFTAGNAVKTASALDAVTYNTAANIATVPAGETKYYKVTVRLWLEGEDNTCNNATFATLTSSWDLDLKFELQDATGGVTNINKAAVAANAWIVSTSASTSDNVTLSGITYYAYAATGTSTKIYGDANDVNNVQHWFTISGTEVYEITEFVTVS